MLYVQLFFFAASVDKQPKPWQLESGVYTDRDRDMDRDRDRERDICRLCTNSAQIDYLPLQMKSKSRLYTDIYGHMLNYNWTVL